MKKILNLLMVIATLVSVMAFTCCGGGSGRENSAQHRESLLEELSEKDAILDEMYLSIGDIVANLNEIKTRENLISSSVGNPELQRESTAQISDDISAIDRLLQDNRATISKLQSQIAALKKTNANIAPLEKLIAELTAQAEMKDEEIARLKSELDILTTQVGELNTAVGQLSDNVQELARENTELEGDLKAKEQQVNTAYYIVGTEKELRAKNIIDKSGLIGRSVVLDSRYDLTDFTRVDIREFKEVMLGQKNMKIVSSHPQSSYELITDSKGNYLSLKITDREKFWERSRILVISHR